MDGDQVLLLKAAEAGDAEKVKQLLGAGVDPSWKSERGVTALMLAGLQGHCPVIEALLQSGAEWNAVDANYKTAGDYAKEGGYQKAYDLLLDHGIRIELIFGVLDRKLKREQPTNAGYLAQKLTFRDNKLLSPDGDAVMMGWEKPLMERHARIVCKDGRAESVLNVGFGLGLVDEEIQKYKPKRHTIIEAHPDVYQHMKELGWHEKDGVEIIFGRWQDVVENLDAYDGKFVDSQL